LIDLVLISYVLPLENQFFLGEYDRKLLPKRFQNEYATGEFLLKLLNSRYQTTKVQFKLILSKSTWK